MWRQLASVNTNDMSLNFDFRERAVASRKALWGDRLWELDDLLRASRVRPSNGQGPDGANRESETDCLEHLCLPRTGVRPWEEPYGGPVQVDVLAITKRAIGERRWAASGPSQKSGPGGMGYTGA